MHSTYTHTHNKLIVDQQFKISSILTFARHSRSFLTFITQNKRIQPRINCIELPRITGDRILETVHDGPFTPCWTKCGTVFCRGKTQLQLHFVRGNSCNCTPQRISQRFCQVISTENSLTSQTLHCRIIIWRQWRLQATQLAKYNAVIVYKI